MYVKFPCNILLNKKNCPTYQDNKVLPKLVCVSVDIIQIYEILNTLMYLNICIP